MGTLISFELARFLRQTGKPLPFHIFAAAHRAPHLPDPLPKAFQLPYAAFMVAIRQINQLSPTIMVANYHNGPSFSWIFRNSRAVFLQPFFVNKEKKKFLKHSGQ